MPFLNNGIAIIDISNNSNDHATGVAIDPSGNIVVVGWTNAIDAVHTDFAVLRFLSTTGQLDPSFGTAIPGISGGIVITDICNNSFDRTSKVTIDTAGRIVVAGSTKKKHGRQL